ncbi:MAG: DUF1289 domain-containing protein, partial [Gammaproteobacteria bacterium]
DQWPAGRSHKSYNMSESTASPCVRICCLDDDNICIGCGSSLDEIRRWSEMPEQDKLETLRQADERCEARRQRYQNAISKEIKI